MSLPQKWEQGGFSIGLHQIFLTIRLFLLYIAEMNMAAASAALAHDNASMVGFCITSVSFCSCFIINWTQSTEWHATAVHHSMASHRSWAPDWVSVVYFPHVQQLPQLMVPMMLRDKVQLMEIHMLAFTLFHTCQSKRIHVVLQYHKKALLILRQR